MKLKHLLVLLLSCFLFVACSDDDEDNNKPQFTNIIDQGIDANGIKWVLQKDGTLTIYGNGEMASYANVDDAEKSPWFAYIKENVNKIVIMDGITKIGDHAFLHCYSMTELTIPNSVTKIGRVAFADCNSLTKLTIPNSVTKIGDNAFFGCFSLNNLTISNSLNVIEDYTFAGCHTLAKLNIPDSVTIIGKYAFINCKILTQITIPSSVAEIGEYAFWNCNALLDIYSYCPVTAYNSATSAFGRIEADTDIYIHVPTAKIRVYKEIQNTYWTPMNITVSDDPAPAE